VEFKFSIVISTIVQNMSA